MITKARNITPVNERIEIAINDLAAISSELEKVEKRLPPRSPIGHDIGLLIERIDNVIDLLENGY